LFLVGGKDGRNDERALIDRFVRLCGGASARVLVITSATANPGRHRKEYDKAFSKSGAREVSVFHAEDPELLTALARADGVYFTGGNQSRLVDAMGVRFQSRLRERHRKGLHVGGTSAGASAVSSVMIKEGRGESVELSAGFGLLPEVIVDQHFRQRERLSRLMAAVLLHPAKLGFGLDERTAVEIGPSGHAQVLGTGALTVVDGSELMGSNPSAFAGMRVHVLTAGWRFHLGKRAAEPPRGARL
jgi:cyanophycinase